MAFYLPEQQHPVGKCPRHPSLRRRSGICPSCLKDRLSALCSDCAKLRHSCTCSVASTSSESSSSSFSLRSSDATASVGKISTLIAAEPSFQRSRSAAPFIRSKFSVEDDDRKIAMPREKISKSSAIWSVFWWQKSKTEKVEEKVEMRKSRSVAAGNKMRWSPTAGKGKAVWYFKSPMKVFRQSKAWKFVVQERSPLQRG